MEFSEVYRRLVETRGKATNRSRFRQAICEEIADVLESTVWIGTADTRAGRLEVHAGSRPDRGRLPQTTIAIDPESAGPTTRVADSGTVQIVPDIDENPEYRHLYEGLEGNYRSSVSVPLEADDVNYGVLHLYTTETVPETAHADFMAIGNLTAQGLRAFETSETLSHQSRRLEHIRSTVSHDLRNPLNIGQGRLEIVRSECDHPDLEHVDYGFNRMEQLVEETLTFARAGEPVETTVPLSLEAVCREYWTYVKAEPGSLTVTGDRTIHADPERMHTLLEELYLNAVEHGRDDESDRDGEEPSVFS